MSRPVPEPDLLALGIRQPWVELILRGIKTVEVRSTETARRGRIYLYAAKNVADIPAADAAVVRHALDLGSLPRGVVVGTAELVACRPCRATDAGTACVPGSLLPGNWAWELADPQRLAEPLPIRFRPYGIWFYPFRRRNPHPTRGPRGTRSDTSR